MSLGSEIEKEIDQILGGDDAGKVFDVMQKLNDEAQKIKMHISRNMEKYKNCKDNTFLKETDIDSIVSQCKTSLELAERDKCQSIKDKCLCIDRFIERLETVGEGNKNLTKKPDEKDYHCCLDDIIELLNVCNCIQTRYKYMAEKLKK